MIKQSLPSPPTGTIQKKRHYVNNSLVQGLAEVRCARLPTAGFTLIELLATLTLLVILISLGVPNFRVHAANSSVTDAANAMLGAINQARHEAVTRGRPVCLCQSDDGSSCGDSDAWESGWILIERACSDSGETLGIQSPIDRATIVGDITVIDFTSRGYLLGNSVGFRISAPQGTRTRHVCVSRIGLARVQVDDCS